MGEEGGFVKIDADAAERCRTMLVEGDSNVPTEYLGDGAYVRFTGYCFVIYTTDGLSVQNEVHLDASALKVLDHFVERMKREHGGA